MTNDKVWGIINHDHVAIDIELKMRKISRSENTKEQKQKYECKNIKVETHPSTKADSVNQWQSLLVQWTASLDEHPPSLRSTNSFALSPFSTCIKEIIMKPFFYFIVSQFCVFSSYFWTDRNQISPHRPLVNKQSTAV